ncbi:TPA: hypothetical protein ACH3X3_013047 [Trebouxia sp. C0006]
MSAASAFIPARPHVVFSSNDALSCRQILRQPARPLRQQRAGCSCEAAKGFAPSGKTGSKKNKRKLDANWISVGSLAEFPGDRPTRAVVLKDKSVVMLYNVDGDVYCSDANSTAFKFPLTHAKIVKGETGPAVEVPLDGTIYDLETGKVLEWCPKNNLIRKVLGSIKSNQNPKKLKVYPAQVDDDGNISVKFFSPGATI